MQAGNEWSETFVRDCLCKMCIQIYATISTLYNTVLYFQGTTAVQKRREERGVYLIIELYDENYLRLEPVGQITNIEPSKVRGRKELSTTHAIDHPGWLWMLSTSCKRK